MMSVSPISTSHRIVIVGGGAAGLELATKLGDRFHRLSHNLRIHTTLIDRSAIHIWKPLLHKAAAGSLEVSTQQVEYLAQAYRHHFTFRQGDLIAVDRVGKTVTLAAVCDEEGAEILPLRDVNYDTLILAIGSETNFFDVPGTNEHALAIDTVRQAEHFRRRLVSICMRVQSGFADAKESAGRSVHIVVIGGGATGVELAAELRDAGEALAMYERYDTAPPLQIHITVVDSGKRILAQLPQELADKTIAMLGRLHIEILSGEQVSEVQENAVLTTSGKRIPSDITVWTAGIKMPAVLARLGLPTNKTGQILVTENLQSQLDKNIFAIGDCASCPWPGHEHGVPPLAQAAHQQASAMVTILRNHVEQRSLPPFRYHDHGTLLSLGERNAVGELEAGQYAVRVKGALAQTFYFSLYRMHVLALHGLAYMLVDTLEQWLRDKTTPHVKLH
jgi:NADH dehydrogenase